MQLSARALLAVVMLGALALPALADGDLELRTVYYKERSTRVEQPMLDTHFDAGEHGAVDAHLLVDAITSASIAAGAADTTFSETRYEAGAGYTHTLGLYTVGGTAKYSTEPDYKSAFVTAHAQAEYFQRNLTLGLTVGGGHDDVFIGTTPVGALHSYLASASVAQVLSPNAIGSLTYDLSYLDGVQENPYRTVIVDDATAVPHEEVPDQRTRHAFAATVRWFAEPTSTTLVATYRYYLDDWGIRASTPELRVIQDAGDTMQLSLRYRYHRQNAADFYRDRYPTMQEFITSDTKLSKYDSHQFATKFVVTGATFGFEDRLGAVQGELIIEYDVQHNAFGNAIEAQAAIKVPFEY